MNRTRYFAHSTPTADKSDWQPLDEHLRHVAGLAAEAAARFGAREWGHVAGLLHDLGKYSGGFQLRLEGGARLDHATAGAIEAGRRYRKGGSILQYVVAGHHAGLADADGETQVARSTLKDRLNRRIEPYDAFEHEIELPLALPMPPLRLRCDRPGFQMALFTRMLFGALVDADYRDTAAFYDRLEGRQRPDDDWPSMAELRDRLEAHLARFGGPRHAVDEVRAQVLDSCRVIAKNAPGRFTLTVPTGGGKTLASLAFALRHAATHGLDRVIYVVPFTSIIEQNAGVFRYALGDEPVLEHHTGYDDRIVDKDARDKLRHAAPRFAAPVTVTTAVQFFESLFTNRPGRARKLPAFARAVIVLDEVQTLPLELLRPCVAALDELARHYRSTIVLCTATQPAVTAADGFKGGLDDACEIAPEPRRLYERLRRVRVLPCVELDEGELARRLALEPQALCIVDTRSQARELHAALNDAVGVGSDCFHLSTWMCPAHRRKSLSAIRGRLASGEACRVVSTTLIEAGVDVDFPTVYRAECGIDQLAQAAGRCNRNGLRSADASQVHVFKLRGAKLRGERQRRASIGASVLRRQDDPLSLDAVRDFFHDVYWISGELLDAKNIMPLHEERAADGHFYFAKIAAEFRMIDDEAEPVLIPFDDEARRLLAALRAADRPPREVMRGLQQYFVGLRRPQLATLLATGAVQLVGLHEAIYELVSENLYLDDIGLVFDDPTARSIEDNII